MYSLPNHDLDFVWGVSCFPDDGLPNEVVPPIDLSGTGSGEWANSDVSPAESTISLPAYNTRPFLPYFNGDEIDETMFLENTSRNYHFPQHDPPATNPDSPPCLTINPMDLPIVSKPEEDTEVESETDASADSDGDYAPPSGARSYKRGRPQSGPSSGSTLQDRRAAKRAAYTYAWSQSSSDTPSPQTYPAPSRRRAQRRERQPPPARNIQVTSDFGDVERLNFRCPVNACTYKNTSRRLPDFKRHLNSHRGVGAVKCVGVRVSDVSRYLVLTNEKPYDIGVEGEEHHVGGCMRSFSRSDALARHVKNGPCAHYNKRA